MESGFREKLSGYLRAGYPAIYLQTYEESRAITEVAAVAALRGRSLFTWELDRGWRRHDDTSSSYKSNAPLPSQALEEAINGASSAIYLFKDFHLFLGLPEIHRKIKSALNLFSGKQKTFIFLSCRIMIPPELEKEVVLLDLALPNREDLIPVLEAAIETTGDKKISQATKNALVEAALGLTTVEAENSFALSRIQAGAFDKEAVKVVQAEKAGTLKKGGLLEWWPNVEPLESLGGVDSLKSYLRQAKIAFSPEAKEFGIDGLKGVLLLGAAGTGKSLAAKTAASVFEWPLFRLDMGCLFGSLVGQSEERTRAVCHLMETVAPCVILLDEAEKAMAGLGGSGVTDSGVSSRVLGTLLTWLQEHTAPVYVVGTCNSITGIPPELVDRFDACFFLDLPSESERAEIFSIHLRKRRRNPKKFGIAELALASEGHTGRDIERVIKWSLISALIAGREVITQDIMTQLQAHVPTVQIKGDDISEMRNWARKRGVRPASSGTLPEAQQKNKRRIDINPLNN